MMNISYKEVKDFSENELSELFLSVGWVTCNIPDKLKIAMQNYKTVYSAYDNDKLIGLICVMDDGALNAYIHYLLVHPDYQKKGIGKTLLEKVKENYKEYIRIVLIADDTEVKFYEKIGFKKMPGASALII